jgi:hypothetical protein
MTITVKTKPDGSIEIINGRIQLLVTLQAFGSAVVHDVRTQETMILYKYPDGSAQAEPPVLH